MKMMSVLGRLFSASFSIAILAALDSAYSAAPPAGITIGQGWTNETANTHSAARGFFTIHNAGAASDVLMSVTCPVAHRTSIQNKQNHNIPDVPIRAGQTVAFNPGGLHLFMTEPHFRFYRNAEIPCSVMFRGAGTFIVYLHVEPATVSSYQSPGTSEKPLQN